MSNRMIALVSLLIGGVLAFLGMMGYIYYNPTAPDALLHFLTNTLLYTLLCYLVLSVIRFLARHR